MKYLVLTIKDGSPAAVTMHENRAVAFGIHDKIQIEPGVRVVMAQVLDERYGGDRKAPELLAEVSTDEEQAPEAGAKKGKK
jgi:hypothetical protein